MTTEPQDNQKTEYSTQDNLKRIIEIQIGYLNQMINVNLTSGELKLRMASVGSNLMNVE